MNINFFEGKLGHEHFLVSCEIEDSALMPSEGELVYLPTRHENEVVDGDTYIVKQILKDVVHNEYNVFVRLYDWED